MSDIDIEKTEDEKWFLIRIKNTTHFQRAYVLEYVDNPLSRLEETIIALCEKILEDK